MPPSDRATGPYPALIAGTLLLVAAIVAGIVWVPPYTAQRELMSSLKLTAHEVEPTQSDDEILGAFNKHLAQVPVSRYAVEGNSTVSTPNLQLTLQQFKVVRDGNRSLELFVDYTQEVWFPVWGRVWVHHFTGRASSLE
jgi:hypothetical protein